MAFPHKIRKVWAFPLYQDVTLWRLDTGGRSPSGLGYSPRCRSAPMAFGRGTPSGTSKGRRPAQGKRHHNEARSAITIPWGTKWQFALAHPPVHL